MSANVNGHRDERGPAIGGVRRSRHGWALAVAVGLCLLTGTGCEPPGRPREANRPRREDQVVDFSALYGRNCAGCHGADGKLGPAPPLNDAVFLDIVPDDVLLRVIREGRPGTPMPAFARGNGGLLTDAQVEMLAGGIKSRWKPARSSPGSAPPYTVATAEADPGASDRGVPVFRRACAGCHGPQGGGKSDGAGAINDPAFLALVSDQVLRRYVITGRPDLGMPNYAAKAGRPDDFRPITPAEVDDLAAMLARWRRQVPGVGE